MADAFDSPIDIAAEAPPTALSGLAQMAGAVGIAVVLLLLFNAHALAGWADALEPGPRTERVNAAAQALAQQTEARGLDRPRAALNDQWDRLKGLRWSGQTQDHRKKS